MGIKEVQDLWICPKCGRTFKRQEQRHYCGKVPETVEEYIAERFTFSKSLLIRQEKDADIYLKSVWKITTILQLADAGNRT